MEKILYPFLLFLSGYCVMAQAQGLFLKNFQHKTATQKSFEPTRMHPVLINVVLAVIGICGSLTLSAQNILTEYDSIPFAKPKLAKNQYRFNNEPKEIQIQTHSPKPLTKITLRGRGEGLITLLTGIGLSDYEELSWVLFQKLSANDTSLNWTVHVFCEGEFEKTRERVENDDGSWSVYTQKNINLNWKKNAFGIVIERGDTIGRLRIIREPWEDAELATWRERIYAQRCAASVSRYRYEASRNGYFDFALVGTFRNQKISIISSAELWRSLILIEGKPQGIFQSDNDPLLVTKKPRLSPYLLLDNTIPDHEKKDWIRLSMLTRLMATTLAQSTYSK